MGVAASGIAGRTDDFGFSFESEFSKDSKNRLISKAANLPIGLYKPLHRKDNGLHGIVTFHFFVELAKLIQQDLNLMLLLKSEEQHGLYIVSGAGEPIVDQVFVIVSFESVYIPAAKGADLCSFEEFQRFFLKGFDSRDY